jgi:lipopolysaccharide/colanic/teichoic acid biosynthesis glycosyltransferase
MARRADSLRRALDVVVAGTLLVLCAPVLGLAVLAVRVGLGKPVLYRQKRAGRDGIPFELVKLRTMLPETPGDAGPDSDRQRLNPLGRFLRATSIDELPSLMSVVRGDMSIVGPRPLPVRYLTRYSARHARRHEVRPGLTGWAQVNGRNALEWEERLDLDVWYVEHRSVLLDLRIMLRTVAVVLSASGISHGQHATMPEMPDGR